MDGLNGGSFGASVGPSMVRSSSVEPAPSVSMGSLYWDHNLVLVGSVVGDGIVGVYCDAVLNDALLEVNSVAWETLIVGVSEDVTPHAPVARKSLMEATRAPSNFVWPLNLVAVECIPGGKIVIPDSLAMEGMKKLKNSQVGVVLGRRLPLEVVNCSVRRMWPNKGAVDVIGAGPSEVLIRFEDD